jgi:hypothetical protein
VAQDLIVESKVIARNNVDSSVFLYLPMGKPKSLGFGQEIGLGERASPVLELISKPVLSARRMVLAAHMLQLPSSGHGSLPCEGTRE